MLKSNPKSKNRNINKIISDLDQFQKEKVLAEIKLLKIQRKKAIIMAILSPIGAIIAFLILNFSQIKDTFLQSPKFRVIVEDPFIKRTGHIRVIKLGSKQQDTVIIAPLTKAMDWINVSPGSYELLLDIQNQIVYSHNFYLKNGDSEPIIIPNREIGNIRIIVTNHTPNPPPGSALDISIDASGNGYLWIFNYNKNGQYVLIYPDVQNLDFDNKIEVNKTYNLPDNNNIGIISEDEPGEEKLLFIVTSSRNLTLANQISVRMSKTIITKAKSEIIKENWGVAELTYKTGG